LECEADFLFGLADVREDNLARIGTSLECAEYFANRVAVDSRSGLCQQCNNASA
jgi:hypothetical protein